MAGKSVHHINNEENSSNKLLPLILATKHQKKINNDRKKARCTIDYISNEKSMRTCVQHKKTAQNAQRLPTLTGQTDTST